MLLDQWEIHRILDILREIQNIYSGTIFDQDSFQVNYTTVISPYKYKKKLSAHLAVNFSFLLKSCLLRYRTVTFKCLDVHGTLKFPFSKQIPCAFVPTTL